MTTETAVANRLGIALASDSAVTISDGHRVKVFDTADKLFELSSRHPVAVMINGNMDCLGIPWEILVKAAGNPRSQRSAKITDWMRDFLEYVEGHMLISDEAIKRYINNVADNEIDAVQREISIKIRRHIFDSAAYKNGRLTPIDIAAIAAPMLRSECHFSNSFQ